MGTFFSLSPNHLTLGRVFLAAAYGACLTYPGSFTLALACLVCVASQATDIVDGYWARKKNIVSNFGICFDPIADKIFVLCAFATLVSVGTLQLPIFAYLLIIIRELGISGLRVLLVSTQDVLLPAERFGKLKSAMQFTLILIFTLGLWLQLQWPESQFFLAKPLYFFVNPPVPSVLFWMVALYTFASSWIHLWHYREGLARAWSNYQKL